MKYIVRIIIILIILNILLLPLGTPVRAAGAVLFISPSSGTYTVGKSVVVKVMIDSGGGVGVNASEGVISYDTSYLTVANLSKTGSIFNLWTSNSGDGPGYSNSTGKINFGGGTSNAYKGNAGGIFTVTFSAKKVGTTKVNFDSGIILAADGKGTNVFSGFGNATFVIKEATGEEIKTTKPTETKPETTKGLLPPLPEVSSPTHPDESTWYANNNPEFTWKILSDLSNVNFSITTDPTSDPGLGNEGIIEAKKFEGVNDGEQYFNIKYQNKSGWGQVAHLKFMVDVTPPNTFLITVNNGGDPTNPTPKIMFSTTDETSGISFYQIKIGDDSKKLNPEDVKDGFFQPSPLAPGEYRVEIGAFDKAQNSASSTTSFIVEPLKAPIITSIPKILNKNEELVIQGTSFYPQVTIKIYIAKSEKDITEGSTKTDDQGNWSYFHKGFLDKGNYEVWAKIIDNRGAQSSNSAKNLLIIISPSIIDTYGWLIILILILIIIFLVLYIVYLKKEYKEERTRIKDETEEVKMKLRKIFSALREETDELIELADKKPGLSETEKRIKEKIDESLDIAEEFLSKEVEDVEKEIRLSAKDLSHK